MGRLELNVPITGVEDLQRACNKAKAERFDAVYVPPFFVETAAAMLGRNQITIVTTAGQHDDLLDTKVMAIEAAARAGANEIIVCPPHQNAADGLWNEVEKELLTLYQICEMNSLIMWVGCRFSSATREVQAKLCSVLPKGHCGLRARKALPEDVQMAMLCGVEKFCASLTPLGAAKDVSMEQLEEAGATQFVLREAPEQKRTLNTNITEVAL